MKLEINVDETMFKDVLEKELKAFSEEELHDILKECIVEFFKNDDNIKKMFLQETYDTYGWGSTAEKRFKGYEPTGLLKRIVENQFDYKEPYEEVKASLIEFCKKDGNLKEVMKGMIADTFQSFFNNCIWSNLDMRASISNIVREEIFGLKSSGQI
jgi:hypothetical protein